MKLLPICLLAFSIVGSASAATLYTSRAAWEAATPGFVTDGLESHGVERIRAGSLVFDAFDFVVPFNHDPIGTCWTGPLPYGCYLTPRDPANMALFGDVHTDSEGSYNEIVFHVPVYAFGLDVLWKEDAEYGGAPLLFDVAGLTIAVRDYPIFLGVVSDVPFTTVHIHGPRIGFAVDNVSYSTVPEPASALLLAAGLLGLGTASRRIARSR